MAATVALVPVTPELLTTMRQPVRAVQLLGGFTAPGTALQHRALV